MARSCLVIVLVACGGASPPDPPAAAPARPAPATWRAPAAPANPNQELVARCATEAVELLGWNPVPDGAHHGSVIKTSIEHGGSADCAPLVADANDSSFVFADTEVDWDWEPKDQADAATIHFIFRCRGCRDIETQVELQRRWHCFSWIEMAHHGTVCQPSVAACDQARTSFGGTSTPCSPHTGSAWCQRGTQTCSDSPWSCANSPTRAPCDRAP